MKALVPDPFRLVLELHAQDSGQWTLTVDGRPRTKAREPAMSPEAIEERLVEAEVAVRDWCARVREADRG